jgi:hypothetical protein
MGGHEQKGGQQKNPLLQAQESGFIRTDTSLPPYSATASSHSARGTLGVRPRLPDPS